MSSGILSTRISDCSSPSTPSRFWNAVAMEAHANTSLLILVIVGSPIQIGITTTQNSKIQSLLILGLSDIEGSP